MEQIIESIFIQKVTFIICNRYIVQALYENDLTLKATEFLSTGLFSYICPV